ncbi:MAG: hypothetical protein V9H69_12335 [Anaerolineae bacterium]
MPSNSQPDKRSQPGSTAHSGKAPRLTGEHALLLALLLVALLTGIAGTSASAAGGWADLLFQSATNTPDPNSPQQTPTPTTTPTPSETPTSTGTPTETPSETPTAQVLPTDTPAEKPTEPPPAPPTDTPLPPPSDTPAPSPTEPAFVSPVSTPAPPIEPPAVPQPALEPVQPITLSLEAAIPDADAAKGPAAVEEEAPARRLDPALFIDNLVIAFGYVWMCFGMLGIAGAALGGLFLWRRRRQPPSQPAPAPGQPAGPPAGQRPPPQPPQPPSPPFPPSPPPPTRVAARHRPSPPTDLD